MIDINSEIISKLKKALTGKFKDIYITGEYIPAPSSMPCVYIEEIDNSTYTRSMTQNNGENHANIVYEINVYSNKKNAKKSECRAICAVIDAEMLNIGFIRMFLHSTPNEDEGIYRMTSRYRAVVSKDKFIFRR